MKKVKLHQQLAGSKFLTWILSLMCLGGLTGTLLAWLHCRSSVITLPSLHELSLFVSSRDLKQLLLTDAMFSVLVLAAALFGRRTLAYLSLFFLKGFCISYLSFIFIFHFQARGLFFAGSVLLFHTVLLLPLQILTAFLFSYYSGSAMPKKQLAALLVSHAAAIIVCAVSEQFALPTFFSRF